MQSIDIIQPGALLGKYDIVRELGRGGMGIVYEAQDLRLQRAVALKVLTPSLSVDPVFRQQFLQEARSMADLHHPHIVQVHALEELDRYLAIEMELLRGGTLLSMLAERTTVGEVLVWCAQILDALRLCHDRGMVHRDIKPSNILFDEEGNAKLSDFGLSKILLSHMELSISSSRSSTFFVGTPQYAPPESWDGEEPTPAWDIYSMGMVMFEAIAGRRVYQATAPMALLKEMTLSKPPRLTEVAPAVSEPLSDLVSRMIDQEPAARPESAIQVLDELRATPEYQSAPDRNSATVVVRRPKKRPLLVAVAKRWRRNRFTVAAVLALLGFVLWLSALSGPEAHLRPSESMDSAGAASVVAPPIAIQESILQTRPVSAEELADLSKVATGTYALFALTFLGREGEAAGQCLLSGPSEGMPRGIVLFPLGLWSFELTDRGSGSCALTGQWSSYQGGNTRILQSGTFEGTGQWGEDGQGLWASVEFDNDQNAARWTESVAFSPSGSTATDTGFWLALESNPDVTSMIYNELLPRRWDWAMAIEEHLPALSRARVRARANTLPREALLVDGQLQEPCWAEVYIDSDGLENAASGIPYGKGAALKIQALTDTLLLGFDIPQTAAETISMQLAIQRITPEGFNAPSYHLMRHADGALAATVTQRGAVRSWDFGGEMQWHRTPNGWQGEIAIPYAAMGQDNPAGFGERYRLNGVVIGADGEPLAHWGYPLLDDTRHGLLLERPQPEKAEG